MRWCATTGNRRRLQSLPRAYMLLLLGLHAFSLSLVRIGRDHSIIPGYLASVHVCEHCCFSELYFCCRPGAGGGLSCFLTLSQ